MSYRISITASPLSSFTVYSMMQISYAGITRTISYAKAEDGYGARGRWGGTVHYGSSVKRTMRASECRRLVRAFFEGRDIKEVI